jgi:hypothetical protein
LALALVSLKVTLLGAKSLRLESSTRIQLRLEPLQQASEVKLREREVPLARVLDLPLVLLLRHFGKV